MSKATLIKLCCPSCGYESEFEAEHAERLLRMPNNGGWQLPDDSPFEFSHDYGVRYKRNKKTDKRAEEADSDK